MFLLDSQCRRVSHSGSMRAVVCRSEYFRTLCVVLCFVGGSLALSRSYGLLVDGSHTAYTWSVLAYESIAAITAGLWPRFLSRVVRRIKIGIAVPDLLKEHGLTLADIDLNVLDLLPVLVALFDLAGYVLKPVHLDVLI